VIQATGIFIVSNDLVVITNFSDRGSHRARKSDLEKAAACVKESKTRSRSLSVSNNVARIVDALECRCSRPRVINSRENIAGLEKTLLWRGIVRSLVMTDYLPGIIDSGSVGATASRVSDGGVSPPRQKEANARAIHPVKAYNIAEVIDSYWSSAGDPDGWVIDGIEGASAEQEPMRAFQRVAGIGKIVAADNLIGTVNIAGSRSGGCAGVIDGGEHAANIQPAGHRPSRYTRLSRREIHTAS
jgi:hypothetical protein